MVPLGVMKQLSICLHSKTLSHRSIAAGFRGFQHCLKQWEVDQMGIDKVGRQRYHWSKPAENGRSGQAGILRHSSALLPLVQPWQRFILLIQPYLCQLLAVSQLFHSCSHYLSLPIHLTLLLQITRCQDNKMVQDAWLGLTHSPESCHWSIIDKSKMYGQLI